MLSGCSILLFTKLMNKNLLTILGIILFVGAGYIYMTSTVSTPHQEGDSMEITTVETKEGDFIIQEGSTVSYVAQKVFLSKPTLEVVGTNSSIQGAITIDDEARAVSVHVQIDPSHFKTDSSRRDGDVAKMFDGPISVEGKDITAEGVMGDGNVVSGTVDLNVTINGITKTLPFEITASLENDTISAEGSSEIMMSEFDVTPPSLLNVYTVEDALGLRFDITAKK